MKVTAVLVTYNRLVFLKESLAALLLQGENLEKILVINNNSTDGTQAFLESLDNPLIETHTLKVNIGGAGGFNYGIRQAYQSSDSDAFWVMDDDTIPTPEALNELVKVSNEVNDDFGFLSSNVRWIDGTSAVMNRPTPSADWNEPTQTGIIKLRYATFVSTLIHRQTVEKVGLPISEFFIWSDDTEFTMRISSQFSCYFVPNSIVIHKIAQNQDVNIVADNSDRIQRYYYSIRNRLYISKHYGGARARIKGILSPIFTFFSVLFSSKHKLKKMKVILKGFFSGLFFNPRIERIEDKK